MNHSRLSTYLLGILLIIVGISVLFHNFNFIRFDFSHLIVPVILGFIGVKLLDRGKRTAGWILIVIGILIFLNGFGIDVGKFIGFAISIAIIYFGYRMIRSKKTAFQSPPPSPPPSFDQHDDNPDPSYQTTLDYETTSPHEESYRAYNQHEREVKHSLIGNLYLTGQRWELKDMNIWHGIGEVKMDLSRALIHEGETVVIVNGWIGDIDLYVPYDLDVSFSAHVNVGDIDVFGNKEGGVNRVVSFDTPHFQDSPKRVRLIVNLLVGDIDVVYV